MTRKNDEKGMLPEVLPDPQQAAADLARGGPRQRTAEHLKTILAAAGIVLQATPGAAYGDTSVPPSKGKPNNGKPPAGDQNQVGKNTGADGKPINPPKPPRPRPKPVDPGYYVVDMLPDPAYVPKPPKPTPPDPGFLTLSSSTPARIQVDGKDTGLRTPQARMRLDPGIHVITLVDTAGNSIDSFTVTIEKGKTITESRVQRAPAPPKPDKSK